MKKILIFGTILGFFACTTAMAAVRDGTNTTLRAKSSTQTTQSRSTTVLRSNNDTGRGAITRNIVSRTATPQVTTRAGAMRLNNSPTRVATARTAKQTARTATTTTARGTYLRGATVAREAATPANATSMADTRTGAAYNQCKTAYFQCMDQFCQLKSDEYKRCSCSSRISNLKSVRESIVETNNKLTEFTENLDVVGMTAAQATAMHTASDGENALAADTSASKALLEAIMKSIRGQDSTVAGKLSDLNSINLSFDTSNAFGITDAGQVIASYNGTELYNAVYPSCRSAVTADCTDAALQRAVTAYLMAIEQDCNTVQTALENKQKELKGAIREGSAMLDLARVENRHKHNSDTLAECINNIESAILSEQVCGENYHKCLDNGEFIDVSTGAPIAGVVRFYELGNLLKFDNSKNAADQKLSKITNNQRFVVAFETKTKKFAADAMDKCVEIADTAWSEYLDKALLAIYYAQQSKVETIKNGCFDLISACYEDKEAAITAAMASLIDGTTNISLMPDKIVLTQQMCNDYITTCNNMFVDDDNNRNIIADYIAEQTDKDRLDACRAVVQQCFDNFGGANYENFYYPSSGIFMTGLVDAPAYDSDDELIDKTRKTTALDWFTLYKYNANGQREIDEATDKPIYVSECAKQVAALSSCADLVEQAFGGLDMVIAHQDFMQAYGTYKYTRPSDTLSENAFAYGWTKADSLDSGENIWDITDFSFQNRRLRPTGVATEVYNNIIDTLSTQCMNLQGKFMEAQNIDHRWYGVDSEPLNVCLLNWQAFASLIMSGQTVETNYGAQGTTENMCPKDYALTVDTPSWGACLCWENGARRSKNGMVSKCFEGLPTSPGSSGPTQDVSCATLLPGLQSNSNATIDDWCTATVNPEKNRVCSYDTQDVSDCTNEQENTPDVYNYVPIGI